MPSQQITKRKNKLCLATFKICGKSTSRDYECIPYENKPIEASKQRLLTSPIKAQINKNRLKLDHLNKLKVSISKRNFYGTKPEYNSTRIQQEPITQRLQSNKLTNTIIKNEITIGDSPSLSTISDHSTISNSSTGSSTQFDSSFSTNQSSSSYYTDSSLSQYTIDTSDDSSSIQSVKSTYLNQFDVNILVCVEQYQATFQGDINLQYSERVRVVHANEDYALVKKITTQECGYVPTSCLTSYSEFIKSF